MTRRARVRGSWTRRRVRRLLSRLDHAILDVATSATLVALQRTLLRRARRESQR